MTTALLALTATLATMAWLAIWARRPTASRYLAIATLPTAIAISWLALQQPLGAPADNPPPGEYTVLGARIDAGEAIYVLLDGDPPRYYRLPYSHEAAEQLQEAMLGEGGAVMDAQEGGRFDFHEAPVSAAPPKQPESPAFTVED